MHEAKIIFPWQRKSWNIYEKIINKNINNIAQLDNILSAISPGVFKPKMAENLFARYYNDEMPNKIPLNYVIDKIIPTLQHLVLSGREVFTSLRVIKSGSNSNLTLSRLETAVLISCAWFGLFNYNYIYNDDINNYPEFIFLNMFQEQNIFVLQCFMVYIMRIINYMENQDENFLSGIIIIVRKKINRGDWTDNKNKITEPFIGESYQYNTPAKLQFGFCDEYILKDIFKSTMSLCELSMLSRFESFITMLVCEKLEPDESIAVLGCEKIINCDGQLSGIKFIGIADEKEERSTGSEILVRHAIIFADCSPKTAVVDQLINDFDRDLNKAYCAASILNFSGPEFIAGGLWQYPGRSSINQVKFIQQLIAASAANKHLIYYPPSNESEAEVTEFIEWAMKINLSINQLYLLYKKIANKEGDIFKLIMNEYKLLI